VRLLIFLGVAVALTGCSQTTGPAPSPTITGGSTPIVYGPAPNDCPSSEQPAQVSPFASPVIGHAPLWAMGFVASIPAPVPHARFPASQHGIPYKVYWVMLAGNKDTVHVVIKDVRTGTAATILTGRDATVEAIFDPARPDVVEPTPGSGEPTVLGFPSSVAISRPGCYEIRASWASGEWHSIFAAGTNGRISN